MHIGQVPERAAPRPQCPRMSAFSPACCRLAPSSRRDRLSTSSSGPANEAFMPVCGVPALTLLTGSPGEASSRGAPTPSHLSSTVGLLWQIHEPSAATVLRPHCRRRGHSSLAVGCVGSALLVMDGVTVCPDVRGLQSHTTALGSCPSERPSIRVLGRRGQVVSGGVWARHRISSKFAVPEASAWNSI
ncbi:hypothetical protein L226DRAFT_158152 [Lentinus tigrinus ALCF2SS1-7]|uniref:uncharacterized protein n=1 Tax=Lentinus tigrinus ALCF2SS1-7 TaxID=1328758 RepID=UPI001165FDA1|nr:hypothetical protein L226DRAFT_158152 [Lentinus tigrinus ALCF2SS1-7]